MKNYGLKLSKQKDPNAFVLGGLTSLPKIMLQPDGQWDAFLPDRELQYNGSFDTYNCTAYGTNAILETLFKRLGEDVGDRSDRYLGIVAGTKPPGNDPHIVAQALRSHGAIAEATLPFRDVSNIAEYFSYKGSEALKCDFEAQDFLKSYEIGHEYVWQGKISTEERTAKIKEALAYSPLGISVSAWTQKDGVYVDGGRQNNHWTMAFGWTDKGIKVFDSYDQTFKIVSWSHNIQVCKRYLLTKTSYQKQLGLIGEILKKMAQIIDILFKSKPVDEPVLLRPNESVEEPKGSLLISWATAIKQFEGYYAPGENPRYPNGTPAWRNNNPGNIKARSGGFLRFKTYEEGWNALLDYLTRAATGKHAAYNPEFTLLRFFQTYAPPHDSNRPDLYAEFVAKEIGVPVSEKIKNLV